MATKEELYDEAKALEIEGRSEMSKEELEEAVAEAKASGGPAKGAASTSGLAQADVEKGWTRGAELDDAAAIAEANEAARLANMGSTGSTAQYSGGVMTTGGAEERPVEEVAAEAAEIRGADAAREAEKVAQTGATNTTPSPDQEGAVEEGKPAVKEAGTGDAEKPAEKHHGAKAEK